MVHTRRPATRGQEERATATTLTLLGGGCGPGLHVSDTGNHCDVSFDLTQVAQKAASGQAPICQRWTWAAF